MRSIWKTGLRTPALSVLILVGLALASIGPTPQALGREAQVVSAQETNLQAAEVLTLPARPVISDTPSPETVTIPGTIQSVLGCPGDWQPDCENTFLPYDEEAEIWQATFDLPAGEYEYKVALNRSWDENYGLNAIRNGPNIPLILEQAEQVTFFYNHQNHWVTDSHNSVIATVVGDFQTHLGCAQNDDPGCLRSWLQDPEGTGVYTFVTTAIPAGDYRAIVAINQSLDETYGLGGAPAGEPYTFSVPDGGQEIYFGYDAETHIMIISTEGAPKGNLGRAQAHWVTQDTFIWRVPGSENNAYYLHYSPTGGLRLEPGGVQGGQEIQLTFQPGSTDGQILNKFPHLSGFISLRLASVDLGRVPDILRGQIALSARDENGGLIDATSIQIPGVLDYLYTYTGDLGVILENGVPHLKVWAPTARNVTLHLYDEPRQDIEAGQSLPMTYDTTTGVWSAAGDESWMDQYYLYEVEVYVPLTGQVERNFVTDPYSISLSMNSRKSQIVNLNDPALKPSGWDNLQKPPLEGLEDIVIYELHVRDFSVFDESAPPEYRGKFKAFTVPDSHGMRHLKALAEAGLTHLHLLPVFDIASIEEDPEQRQEPDYELLATFPPDSAEQQAILDPLRDLDAFNWGYDPLHYNAPEGSYATDPDGSIRILEFREMVMALNASGLRVVMDVVYNHTNASGQSDKSVLDRVVPGYYHRLNADGFVETSTCCQNTATEHNMMRKLMVDSIVLWTTAYKVDGYRFDLMGHHMLSDMVYVRESLDALNLDRHGVDGSQVYVYGEGWDFGEVAQNRRGVNATQLNSAGTGIGVFNDRLRDAARGGNPFSGLQEQGYLTGLFVDPNDAARGLPEIQRSRLLHIKDWILVGLAGNLADYTFESKFGRDLSGREIDYNGSPAGYTQDPIENIVYISAHDNETLFDAIQLKAPPGATLEDRVRMNNLGLSLVMLSQGVPFFHAGDDMLRSKSMDRNSYNSGDWFNRLDFSYETNNWGAGLPPAGENQANWEIMAPLLADPALMPSRDDILFAVNHFQEMLRIRKSSALFRLSAGDQVEERVRFYNTGPDQIPGLIVMSISDNRAQNLDPNNELIVVVFNSDPEAQAYSDETFADLPFRLHPIQAESQDPLVRQSTYEQSSGTFNVPGRTAAVFVSDRAPGQGAMAPGVWIPWLVIAALIIVLVAALGTQLKSG
jgi:pullulanase